MVPTKKLRSAAAVLLALVVLGTTAQYARTQEGGKGKKSDQDRLQGTWEIVSLQKGGEDIPEEIAKTIRLTFKDDKATLVILDINKDGTFKIDAGKKPRTIDLTLDDKTAEGIYAFDGKNLKICIAEAGQPRPTEFKSEGGTQTALATLRPVGGVKEGAKEQAPAGGKQTKEIELFQGRWDVTFAAKGGEEYPEAVRNTIKLTVNGDKVKFEVIGEVKEGSFTIDPTKQPKTIDVVVEGNTAHGIYLFEKDTLKVCAAEPGGARPTEFKAGAGSQAILLVFKRAQGVKQGGPVKGKTEKTGKATIEGSWAVMSAEKGGEKLPEEIAKTIVLTLAKGKITLEIMGMTLEGDYKVDMAKKPMTIDVTMNNESVQGIFILDGDTLKVCGGEPGGARPSEFKTEVGKKTSLLILKRIPLLKGQGKEGGEEARLQEEIERLRANLDQTRQALQEAQERLAQVRQRAARLAQEEARAARRAPQGAGQTAQQRASANNLKQIGLAMHNYHDTYKKFPTNAIYSKDGKPLLSWRVAILPFIDENALYQQFKLDEPWDSEHNKKLLDKMPMVYAPVGGAAAGPNTTFYQVFTGPGTIFEGTTGIRLPAITDGTSNTILAVEAGKAVPWTKPDDIPFDPKKDLPTLGGLFKEGFNILMADGSVRFVRRGFDVPTLRAAITRNGGEVLDLDKLSP
ncbi:MAG TPA: TIGR03067 domain-containing protein [Gemmataceae bacterium]|nr:TIGR03067 domain-containing protein [Gemmataceae bacterium]